MAEINRRWVVGQWGDDIYLVYHDQQLTKYEREFMGDPREHLTEQGICTAIHERVVFNQNHTPFYKLHMEYFSTEKK